VKKGGSIRGPSATDPEIARRDAQNPRMPIRRATTADLPQLTALRTRLWPQAAEGDHRTELTAMLRRPPTEWAAFLYVPASGPCGFAEASLRHDHVNGCDSSPVAFLEGIYLDPADRRQGGGRHLVDAVRQWAVELGCRELASDTPSDNLASRTFHAALGFTETQRVVFFRQALSDGAPKRHASSSASQ
jgi:aminoglycoside 6'-N-acetyltransferase I